jgi:hypothetical protein
MSDSLMTVGRRRRTDPGNLGLTATGKYGHKVRRQLTGCQDYPRAIDSLPESPSAPPAGDEEIFGPGSVDQSVSAAKLWRLHCPPPTAPALPYYPRV